MARKKRRALRKAAGRPPRKRSSTKTRSAPVKRTSKPKTAVSKKKDTKPKNKPKQKAKLQKSYKKLGKDLASAGKLADKYLDLDPLSQVDASRTAETQNMLNNYNALSDPTSAAYAGARTPEMADFMNRYQASTQGYDSRELEALREQRRREVDRGFQSGRAALARQQNYGGVGGASRGAQMLELAKSYGQAGADAENDLFVRGADEKQRRLEGYGTMASGLGEQEFQRGQLARDSYADALRQSQQDQLERQKINLGQEAASKAIKTGGMFGILGIGEQRKNARQQNKLIREVNNANRRPSSGGGGGANAYAEALNQIAEEYS